MNQSKIFLGIDTSNYTTSVAAISENGHIFADIRKGLKVKQGEKGLRQSYALFQHLENLPELIEELFLQIRGNDVCCISVSTRPRPVEGSYMPVFRGGEGFARTLAVALDVPLFCFSHQEGHLAAASYGTELEQSRNYLAWHLSGGTCELIQIKDAAIRLIGGSKDISFGQLLDRAGVAMGLPFPAGCHLDRIALEYERDPKKEKSPFRKIPVKDLYLNLSGLETQFLRHLETIENDTHEKQRAVYHLFCSMADALTALTTTALDVTGEGTVLFSGGVAASSFLRTSFLSNLPVPVFGRPELSGDNAVGIALLGRQVMEHR